MWGIREISRANKGAQRAQVRELWSEHWPDNQLPSGKLVDMNTVIELLREAAYKSYEDQPDKIILLDGFPREMEQAKQFEDKVIWAFW